MRVSSRGARRRDLLVLLGILLLLTGGLAWWSARARRTGHYSRADQLLLNVLTVSAVPANAVREHFASAPAPSTEDMPAAGQTRMEALEAENQQLRTLLGLGARVTGSPVAAQVFGRGLQPWQGYLLVGAGAQQGLQAHMVALTPDGVLGQVAEVADTTANILPLTDPASGIGAKVVRMMSAAPPPQATNGTPPPAPAPAQVLRTIAVGVLKGYKQGACNPGECCLEYVSDQANINPGDQVVTSGLGLVFGHITPAGFPLGTIDTVRRNPSLSTLDISVTPAVNPLTVEWVVVVK